MVRPSWLGRAVRNEHHHAIEQASRRWRRGRRDDSARTHRNILISTQEMTPPSSSRGVGGAERVRRNCCRPRRARQWKHRTAFARLRGVQQQRRSTGAGRGRSSSSSIGSMLEPRSRSRRGDRFMVYVQCASITASRNGTPRPIGKIGLAVHQTLPTRRRRRAPTLVPVCDALVDPSAPRRRAARVCQVTGKVPSRGPTLPRLQSSNARYVCSTVLLTHVFRPLRPLKRASAKLAAK
jgi:hypothetical protein